MIRLCQLIVVIATFASLGDCVKEVIIVGGGLSGASAARTLHNADGYHVTILEARPNRLGGRIWTDRSARNAQGPECELGSLWLHEPSVGSEFSKALDRLELTLSEMDVMEWSTKDGPIVDSWSSLHRSMQTHIIDAIKQQISSKDKKHDFSLSEVITSCSPLNLTPHNITVSWTTLIETVIALTFGTRLTDLSGVDFQGNRLKRGVQVLEGLDEIVNRLIGGTHSESPIEVELGKVVRQIKVDHTIKKVKVRTVDRRSYTADAVILTVPLGVLKAGSIHFEPKLSHEMRRAIENMGVGLVNTVIVEFSQIFWPPDTSMFISTKNDALNLTFPVWLNSFSLTDRPILTSYTYGKNAERIEKLSEKQLQNLALESLKSIFSPSRVSQASVVSLTRSQWNKDPYALGSSSYLPVGISLSDRRELSHHVTPYLYWAGEHTSIDKGGTLEGAYMSGIEAAEALIRDTQTHDTSDL